MQGKNVSTPRPMPATNTKKLTLYSQKLILTHNSYSKALVMIGCFCEWPF